MNKVIETIKSRRSVRAFLPDPIEREAIDCVIEAATYAPSGHNTQPWHFTVIRKRGLIERINEAAKDEMRKSEIEWVRKFGSRENFDITYKAPVLILVSGRKDAITWQTDCAAAIQNLLLAAESLGIGTLWLGFAAFAFRKPGLAAEVGIPEGCEPFYGVALGRKDPAKPALTPERRKDVTNYVD